MKKKYNFLKKDIFDDFSSNGETFIEAKKFAENTLKTSNETLIDVLFNRKVYIIDILEALNSDNQNLILLSGFQGTGKTEIIKLTSAFLDEKTAKFIYNCSDITNLDDIILNLYSYMNRFGLLERQNKVFSMASIDEKLIYQLNNFKTPLFIVIDSFEKLLNPKMELDPEIFKFLCYLLSLKNVKLIISGKRVVNLDYDEEKTLNLKIGGLEENEISRILTNAGISESNHTLYQIYQATRGYPENIVYMTKAIKTLDTTAFAIIQELSTDKCSFEEFIIRKIYTSIPHDYRKLLWFLTLIRHPVKTNAIEELNLVSNPKECLEYLVNTNLVSLSNKLYTIKDYPKNIILEAIPDLEKIKLHKSLNEIYTEQIPKKPEDRIFRLSRKLLHSEQYYHYISSEKISKSFNSIDSKSHNQADTNILNDFKKNHHDLSYLPPTMAEALIWAESLIKEEPQKNETPKLKTEENFSNIDFDIDLTDEEKSLLEQDFTDKPEPETVKTKINQKNETSSEHLKNDFILMAMQFERNKKYDQALEFYNKVQKISQNTTDNLTLANVTLAIGNIYHKMHRYEEAIEVLNKTLALFKKLNDINNVSLTLVNLANVYNDCYKHDEAIQYYKEVILLPPGKVKKQVIADSMLGIGEIYEYRGESQKALKYYNDAFTLNIDDNSTNAKLCFRTALAYDDLNNSQKALEFYHKNVLISKDTLINPYLSSSYSNIAAIYEEMGDKTSAIEYYILSLDIDILNDSLDGQYKTLSRLGNIYFELENYEEAFKYFQKELETAKETADPYWIATAYLDIGDLYLDLNKYEKAIKAFVFARKTIGNTISTDSREKIDRRFKQIISEIGQTRFNLIVEMIGKKNAQY